MLWRIVGAGCSDDNEYIYVKASSAFGATGEVAVIDNDNEAAPLTSQFERFRWAAHRRCSRCGRSKPLLLGVLVRGDTEFLAGANCAANATLRATTVGGVVDDGGSGPAIEGLVATEAAGSMQTLVSGRATYPTLQEQAAGGGGGGASDFLSLDDTPAAFGTSGQVPAVNTAETALEFVDQSGGGGAFDLHDDVTTALTAISGTDRFVLSDESSSGDPNRYITHSQLLNGIRDIFTANNAAPASTDRFYVSDESASGDPIEYLTFAQLETAIQDGTVDTVAMTVCGANPDAHHRALGRGRYRGNGHAARWRRWWRRRRRRRRLADHGSHRWRSQYLRGSTGAVDGV